MKKILITLSVVLLCILGGSISYSMWNNEIREAAESKSKKLTVTAEKITSTNAVLHFTHPDPKILNKYSILDDCIFIFKKTSEPIRFMQELEPVKFKEATTLTLNSDSTAILEKNWGHLYGELQPGDYAMGIFITQKSFFSEIPLSTYFIDIKIPEK